MDLGLRLNPVMEMPQAGLAPNLNRCPAEAQYADTVASTCSVPCAPTFAATAFPLKGG